MIFMFCYFSQRVLVGDGLIVAVAAVVGVGETFVVSFAGIEKLLLPLSELPQAVNKPVAIAVSNKINSLRERNIMFRDVAF
jgi:putative effector of murein hydrolase